jgi:hypothetical protein
MHLPLFKRVLHLTRLKHDAEERTPRGGLGAQQPGAVSR